MFYVVLPEVRTAHFWQHYIKRNTFQEKRVPADYGEHTLLYFVGLRGKI
ncbi:hypothetical protein [Dictyobacter formicarum]|uniref:Uncharacterized protein n=1 Tax=Dictyobacter formicarum TaxID=2778368 RepID=A0ABQ3VEF0_9CHLR|nr:hypothetical protein [Dictyobacter formicarum]GHO83876.1 hypothetical protein KSZ_18820 [Dictyobacter formicarum]